ncbi:hypothetical protein BDV93DRAFT_566140 [Ceratobasidium sp. AG-I]|nr:hypothetical protein BDV93DRAFT_566140 [Ceratobasidium sp. AG-I]
MSTSRSSRSLRELSWDSLRSSESHIREASQAISEDTPVLEFSTPALPQSFSVPWTSITPQDRLPILAVSGSWVKEQARTEQSTRAVSFDSIDSEVEIIPPVPRTCYPGRNNYEVPTTFNSPANESLVQVRLLPPPVKSPSTSRGQHQHMSWRSVLEQPSSSPAGSTHPDEDSDVDVETLSTSGASTGYMEDLDRLKLELEEMGDSHTKMDSVCRAEVQGEEQDEKSIEEVSNLEAFVEDSDLEIIDKGNHTTNGKTHQALARLVKERVTHPGQVQGRLLGQRAKTLNRDLGPTGRVLKRAKPRSPRPSAGKVPTSRKKLKLSVEIPTPRTPRTLSRPAAIPAAPAPPFKSQVSRSRMFQDSDNSVGSIVVSEGSSETTLNSEDSSAGGATTVGPDKEEEAVNMEATDLAEDIIDVEEWAVETGIVDLEAMQVNQELQNEEHVGEGVMIEGSMAGGVIDISDGEESEDEDEQRIVVARLASAAILGEGVATKGTMAGGVIDISDGEESEDEDERWIPAVRSISADMLTPLVNCNAVWSLGGYDWEAHNESNPIWDLLHAPLMSELVMDQAVAYLVYHAKLMEKSAHRQICVVPSSLFGAMKQIEHLSSGLTNTKKKTPEELKNLLAQRDLVWSSPVPPTRIILPVIDHQQVHCYLWYGDIYQKPGRKLFHCKFTYLDSLQHVSDVSKAERFALVKTMVKTLLPQIDGEFTCAYPRIAGYVQDAGSTDCGVFVCQAVSALSFHQDDALQRLQPVAIVRANLKQILESCGDKALLNLSSGLVAKEPILLHTPRTSAPPPWLVPKPAQPTSPPVQQSRPARISSTYARSLSEPRETHQTLRLRRPPLLGWNAVFGPMPQLDFQPINPERVAHYLQHLGHQSVELPEGVLVGVSSSAPDHFLESLLLCKGKSYHPRWLPGITVVENNDEEELEQPEDCLGLNVTVQALSHLRPGQQRSEAILCGTNAGHHIRLDWTKDALDLEEEWMSASLDVDSLSLTAIAPEFTMPAVLHAYPPRASTLTTNNHLFVNVDKTPTPLSHILNFTFLNIGQNNQFRVNIFFPHYHKGVNKSGQHITIMLAEDFKAWYEQVVLHALEQLSWNCPPALRDTCTRLMTELPRSYASAEAHCVNRGVRSFTGYKVMPQILNLLLHYCRITVDSTVELARFKGFFYHIFGMNMKAVCELIPERSKGNPMLHVLQQYPIVDWSLQNYADIAVDVGLEISICRDRLPAHLDNITLVWKIEALQRLIASSWCKPDIDPYVHSHVVGGLSTKPRVHASLWFYYLHFYMKDKTLTYIHRDNSIGTGFSPEQGILGSSHYRTQTQRLQQVWADGRGSFGVRAEWRVGLRTANEILQQPPKLWLQTFMDTGAIVALRTQDVVKFKSLLLDAYTWHFSQIQQLLPQDRASLPVGVLGCALSHLVHGLVSAPGTMSSERSMVKNLEIVSRARRFGMPSIPRERLGPDMRRVRGRVTVESFPILKYITRKNPAGARMKHSTLQIDETDEPEEGSGDGSSTGQWTDEDQKWVEHLINIKLAEWLWTTLPAVDQLPNGLQIERQGPFRLSKWPRVAGELVQYGVRKSRVGFKSVQQLLFPENWILRDKGKQWDRLEPMVLDPILSRIETITPTQRIWYSARLRQAVETLLMQWEFLPSSQKKQIWVAEGKGRTRQYMVYTNPRFTRSRA